MCIIQTYLSLHAGNKITIIPSLEQDIEKGAYTIALCTNEEQFTLYTDNIAKTVEEEMVKLIKQDRLYL